MGDIGEDSKDRHHTLYALKARAYPQWNNNLSNAGVLLLRRLRVSQSRLSQLRQCRWISNALCLARITIPK